jgi:gliding motility-associatede transport system auxiliary component
MRISKMGGKKISGNYFKFFVYLVVIVLINLVGLTAFFRADLTENQIYSISEASKRVVSSLSEPLTVKVFFTKNLPAPHNNTERYLHDLLEEYSIHGNRYFNYQFYDVNPDTGDLSEQAKENQELARNYGIHPVQIEAIEKDEVKFQRAYMGLALIHGDMIERIPTITSTVGLEYQLTMAIQKLNNKISALLSLEDKIQIKLFLSSSLQVVAPYMRLNDISKIPDKLESIVEELNDKSYGKLEFEYLDPTKDQSLETLSEKYNLMNLKWPALSGGEIQPGKGTIGLVMEYGDKAVTIPLLQVLRVPLIGTRYTLVDLEQMEEIISENLESLIDINEDLGYLVDQGTLQLSGAPPADPTRRTRQDFLSSFQSLISKNHTIKNVNLKDGKIPDSFNCLVIVRPTEKFTDYELFQIDQFLMRGKNLALFLDAFNEIMPPSQRGMSPNQGARYVPLNTGLEKLLEHYGIRIKKSYAMDENSYRQRVPARFGGGEQAIYFAPIIKNQSINKELDFMANIKGLVTIKISPLELDAERIAENDIKAHRLFSSSEKSWEMREPINLNPMFIRPPQSKDEQQSLDLAYILEGEFPSYFDGKPVPETEESEKDSKKTSQKIGEKEKSEVDLSRIERKGEFLTKGRYGKIFLMASSEMLKDNILDARGSSPNTTFILNVVDFLNNREDIAVMRNKEQRFNPLDDTEAGTKTFVKSFNIVALPILVNLFGLLVWFRRHSRKKRIQMMFQK